LEMVKNAIKLPYVREKRERQKANRTAQQPGNKRQTPTD
jgi:hypothetical protein